MVVGWLPSSSCAGHSLNTTQCTHTHSAPSRKPFTQQQQLSPACSSCCSFAPALMHALVVQESVPHTHVRCARHHVLLLILKHYYSYCCYARYGQTVASLALFLCCSTFEKHSLISCCLSQSHHGPIKIRRPPLRILFSHHPTHNPLWAHGQASTSSSSSIIHSPASRNQNIIVA